jgi:hypothetical protein
MYEKSSTDSNEDGEEMEENVLDNKREVKNEMNHVILSEFNFQVLSSWLVQMNK